MIKKVLSFISQHISEYLFSSQCAYCKNEKEDVHFLCSDCIAKLSPYDHTRCVADSVAEAPVISLFPVSELSTRIVYDIKYNALPNFGKVLIQHAEQSLFTEYFGIDTVLIPVPLHSTRKRERGFNQALELALALSKKTGAVINKKDLGRKRYTVTQTKLGAEERKKNISNAFVLRQKHTLQGKNIVVVDDVFTTGATTDACVTILKEANPKSIMVFTLLRTELTSDQCDFEKELQLS